MQWRKFWRFRKKNKGKWGIICQDKELSDSKKQ